MDDVTSGVPVACALFLYPYLYNIVHISRIETRTRYWVTVSLHTIVQSQYNFKISLV